MMRWQPALLALLALSALGCDDEVAGAAVDAMFDRGADAMPDVSPDAIADAQTLPDGNIDGAPDASESSDGTADSMPDASDDTPDGMPQPDALPDVSPRPQAVLPLDDELPPEPTAVALPDDAVVYTAFGRPCRGDLYVVDAIFDSPAPVADFAPVAAELEARARRDFAAWFCAEGAPCDGADRVRAAYEQLLPAETVGAEDAGRFHRLWFEVDGVRLTADDGAQCDIVTALRAAVDAHGDLAAANVSRACDAVAQSPTRPTPEMLGWHLERMGIVDDGAPTTEVHLALIDTAVDPAVAEAIDLRVHPGPVDTPAIHGTAMAILARQVAPDAVLHLFPVLDADHVGPVGDVARAIAHAMDVMPAGAPRIINLSLGWPPESRSITRLTGTIRDGQPDQCAVDEDPVGAPVRHMLDRAADGEAMVFAAAGNRNEQRWLDDRLVQQPDLRDACAIGWQGELQVQSPKLFYPAQWGLERSCRAGDARGRRLAVPVGAHDERDRAAALQVDFGFATIIAPGQHVMVDGPAVPRGPSICVDGDTPPPLDAQPSVRLPATLSGSSVATALTTGLAARWLGRLDAALGFDPDEVTPRQIELLLHATGRPLCLGRRAYLQVGYRGVRWPGMAALAQCRNLPALLNCLTTEDDGLPPALGETVAACSDRFEGCGVDVAPAADCEAERPPAPDWADAECLPLRPDDPEAPDLSRACDGPCPFDGLAPDRYSVGGLGPQPQDPWCPDCRFTVQTGAGGVGRVTLDIALNPDAPSNTDIVSPILWVETESGAHVYVALQDYVPRPYWKPGAGFTIGGIKMTLPDDPPLWGKVDARLVLYVQQPDGKTIVRDVSPLRLIVR